jgi:hypothetical protein
MGWVWAIGTARKIDLTAAEQVAVNIGAPLIEGSIGKQPLLHVGDKLAVKGC